MAIDPSNFQNKASFPHSPKFGRHLNAATLAEIPSHFDFSGGKSFIPHQDGFSFGAPQLDSKADLNKGYIPYTPGAVHSNLSGRPQLRSAKTGSSSFSNPSSIAATTVSNRPASKSASSRKSKARKLSQAVTPDIKTLVEQEKNKLENKYSANGYTLSDDDHAYYSQLLRARYYLSPTKILGENLLSPESKLKIKKVSAGRVKKSTKKKPSIMSRVRAHRNSVPSHYQGRVRALEMAGRGGQLMHIDIPLSMPKVKTSAKPNTSWRKVKSFLTPAAMQDIHPSTITYSSGLGRKTERWMNK